MSDQQLRIRVAQCPDDLTEDELLLYIEDEIKQRTAMGMSAMPIDVFYNPGDLEHFRAARDWWYKGAPPMEAVPSLPSLCNSATGRTLDETCNFYDTLDGLARRHRKWCIDNNINPDNPNESKQQRRSRLGREAQARYRARTKQINDPTEKQSSEHVSLLYKVYMDLCRERKLDAARWRTRIDEAMDEYQEARAAHEAHYGK